MLEPEDITRVLVVTAHPDDVDFGSAGGFDRDVPRSEMPRIRRDEQRAAAAVVGVADVTFLGRMDGELEADAALCREVSRHIRRVRPDLVITSTPERNYDRVGASHPDHRAVGSATLDAVYPFARNPFAFPDLLDEEGLEPHVVREVWFTGHPVSDHAVDVTDVFERKLEAILAHASQMTDPDGLRGRIEQWTSRTAVEHGLPEGRRAEAYRRTFIQ